MPKSKRTHSTSKQRVKPTRTKPKTKSNKSQLIDRIQECVSSYTSIYIFQYMNMRNHSFKELRDQYREQCKFFLGKTSIMQLALGRTADTEMEDNVHLLTQHLIGNRGLLFTNESQATIQSIFDTYEVQHYARSGTVATSTVTLPSGAIDRDLYPRASHFSMEGQLRKLGLPTALKNGVITLTNDVSICKEGDVLTADQCKLLELFDIKQAIFKIRLLYVYQNGDVKQLNESQDEQSASHQHPHAQSQSHVDKNGVIDALDQYSDDDDDIVIET